MASVIEAGWTYLITHFSDFQLACLGSFFIHEAVFFLSGLPFIYIERTGCLRKYKIQTKSNTAEAQEKCIARLLLYHFCVNLPVMLASYPVFRFMGMRSSLPLPSWYFRVLYTRALVVDHCVYLWVLPDQLHPLVSKLYFVLHTSLEPLFFFSSPSYAYFFLFFIWVSDLFAFLLCRKVISTQILFYFIVEDFIFYWGHRILHTKWLYKHVHSVHHEYATPFGLTSEYAHPAEILFLGFATIFGPAITGPHLITLWLWMVVRVLETVEAHCGYHFPWSPSNFLPLYGGSDFHDYHHRLIYTKSGNYSSTFVYMDWIFGTDSGYRKLKALKSDEVAECKDN